MSSRPAAENLGEWARINNLLAKDGNAEGPKVKVSQWTWSDEVPVPPWSIVVKAPLWSSPEFAGLREQLARPLERHEVHSTPAGGLSFTTVRTLTIVLAYTTPASVVRQVKTSKDLKIVSVETGSATGHIINGEAGSAVPHVVGTIEFRLALICVPRGWTGAIHQLILAAAHSGTPVVWWAMRQICRRTHRH